MDKETCIKSMTKISNEIVDNLTEEEIYDVVLEFIENVGVDAYNLSLIQNTLDYCKNYIIEYDETEIKKNIIQNQYIPCFDDLNETTFEIISDLGYEEKDW